MAVARAVNNLRERFKRTLVLRADGEDVLICPTCHGPLQVRQTERTCDACRVLFPVVQRIPIMDPADAYFVGRVS